jgi:hypothetical protein
MGEGKRDFPTILYPKFQYVLAKTSIRYTPQKLWVWIEAKVRKEYNVCC